MTTVAVIPARFASQRFPGKPIARDTGKFLVQHVYERAGACPAIDRVIVATDDSRILEAVESFGGEVMMTRDDHPTGTDRIAEVVAAISLDADDLVLNVQGDEPETSPDDLGMLVGALGICSSEIGIATLAARFPAECPRKGAGSPADPNCVKVVVDRNGRAMYFSRSLIPYPRGDGGEVSEPSAYLLHLGVYAFRAGVLRKIVAGDRPGLLESVESLEQLRWLEQGYSILVKTAAAPSIGIDTPEDYRMFVERCAKDRSGSKAKLGSPRTA